MIICPHCGASHYSESYSSCTAVYYPPIWKNGVNVNPDMNITTTRAHCYECNYDFIIKYQNGKVWTEEGKYNSPNLPVDVNITSTLNEYVPLENQMKTSIATINNNHEAVRLKYIWEEDIEDLKKRVEKLESIVNKLVRKNIYDKIN